MTTALVNIATGAANPRDSLFSVNLETGLLSNLGSTWVALIDSAGVIPEPGAAVVGVWGWDCRGSAGGGGGSIQVS